MAASSLATTQTFQEDPTWLIVAAHLEGVWDSDPLGLSVPQPNVSVNFHLPVTLHPSDFQLYTILDEALSRAWGWFVDRRPDHAEDIAMAKWACLFNDGQAMDPDDQVSDFLLQLLPGFSC